MDNKEHAKNAANALANLYVLDAIVCAVSNGATHHSLVGREVQQIVKIAERAKQKMLKKYDNHIAALSQ